MARKKGKPPGQKTIVLYQEMVRSTPFKKLGGIAIVILMEFFCRRVMSEIKHPRRGSTWVVANNGELVLTFREALQLGIAASNFTRGIKRLIYYGFLDVTRPGIGGTGLHNQPTFYALSDRWKLWGTPGYLWAKKPTNSMARVGNF